MLTSDTKSIAQSDIKNLLKERLEHPEKYAEKPLVVWRSYFYDGILDSMVYEVRKDFNKGKSKEEKKWIAADPKRIKKDNLGLFVISFNEDFEKTLKEYQGIPFALFVPFDDNDGEIAEVIEKFPEREEYVYRPDFDEFAEKVKQMKGIPDFLIDFLTRGGSIISTDKELAYRWYNYFNYSGEGKRQGCDYPSRWFDGLLLFKKLTTRMSKIKKLSDEPENLFNMFFPSISEDLRSEFRNYIIKNNL